MGESEPTPDSRKVVDDLEEQIVDLDGLQAEDKAVEETTPDGTRKVPGTPEPPD